MILASHSRATLIQRGNLFIVNYRTGSHMFTRRDRANAVFAAMMLR